MSKGTLPAADTLIKIAVAENVNLDWLLDVREVNPYHVNQCKDDEEAIMVFECFLNWTDDSVWNIYRLTNNEPSGLEVIILSRSEVLETKKDKVLEFNFVQIIAGHYGEKTLKYIDTHREKNIAYRVVCDEYHMKQISYGLVGNHQLFTAHDAILKDAVIDESGYGESARTMMAPGIWIKGSPDSWEKEAVDMLLENYKQLTQRQKDALLGLVTSMIQT